MRPEMIYDGGRVAEITTDWFDIEPTADQAEQISELAIGRLIDRLEINSESVLTWLKSRLIDAGLCKGMCRDEFDGYFVTAVHHMPLLVMSPMEAVRWIGAESRPNYARPSIFRSPLSRCEPIDAVARRLVKFTDESACPYCKRFYRNGAALRLHMVESHGVVAT